MTGSEGHGAWKNRRVSVWRQRLPLENNRGVWRKPLAKRVTRGRTKQRKAKEKTHAAAVLPKE